MITTKAQNHQGQLERKNQDPTSGRFLLFAFRSRRFLVSRCPSGGSFGLVLALIVLVACAGTRAQADSKPDFASQVAPILQKNCLACHSSASKMGGLVMENYDALIKGGAHGAVIIPGSADESRMILMLEGKVQPRMPFGADALPAADIATLKAWVEGGALGPAPGEATKALAPLAIPDIKPQVSVVSPVASVKFSPDGNLLAVGGYREVRFIDSLAASPSQRSPATRIMCDLSLSAPTARCWRRRVVPRNAVAKSRFGT